MTRSTVKKLEEPLEEPGRKLHRRRKVRLETATTTALIPIQAISSEESFKRRNFVCHQNGTPIEHSPIEASGNILPLILLVIASGNILPLILLVFKIRSQIVTVTGPYVEWRSLTINAGLVINPKKVKRCAQLINRLSRFNSLLLIARSLTINAGLVINPKKVKRDNVCATPFPSLPMCQKLSSIPVQTTSRAIQEKLSYRPRKRNLSSRFRENGTDVNQDISSKMQNMRHRYRYENASTSSNHPQGTVDPSIPPTNTSGNRAHHTGPQFGYVHVGTCEHCCEHCGAQFWYEERIKDNAKRARPKYHSHEYELPTGDMLDAIVYEPRPKSTPTEVQSKILKMTVALNML
ncbi:hypothetical protein Tco_0961717 [Tanacetum coccineum]